MFKVNSHGVEISVTGCVEEMFRDPNLHQFFFLFFSFYHVLHINQLLETKSTCSASHGKEKTPFPIFYPPSTREKTINPSLAALGPTAHQPCKVRNETPTKGVEQESQTNTWVGIDRKTLAVETNNTINNCYKHLGNPK